MSNFIRNNDELRSEWAELSAGLWPVLKGAVALVKKSCVRKRKHRKATEWPFGSSTPSSNSSVHNNAKIRKFTEKYPEIELLNLPTHSPEYNPIEQLWKWIKTRIQGAKTMENGCNEILQRIRKLTSDWLHDRLLCKPHIGLGIWNTLLANYI